MVTGLSKVVAAERLLHPRRLGEHERRLHAGRAWTATSAKICFRNFGYNKIYYNPASPTLPPKNADGTSFADGDLHGRQGRRLQPRPPTTDLSATQSVARPSSAAIRSRRRQRQQDGHGHAPDHGSRPDQRQFHDRERHAEQRGTQSTAPYTITTVTTNCYTITSSTNANSTGTGGGNSPTRDEFQPATGYVLGIRRRPDLAAVDLPGGHRLHASSTPATAAAADNFANWYSYYRTRIMMMKSASGRAFARSTTSTGSASDTISNRQRTRTVREHHEVRRDAEVDVVHAACTADARGRYTPLRGALSKAGRLYAGKVVTGNNDPVQYSCQQNFTILTTDGYWNPRTSRRPTRLRPTTGRTG